MVNKRFVQNKINFIQRELVNLEKLSQYSFQEIVSDFFRQSSLERILERIINRAIDINQHLIAELYQKDIEPPKDYRETFLRLTDLKIYPQKFAESISMSVGTRNALVHDYNNIDYGRIYSSISDCLRDYNEYCHYILKFLERQK